MRSSLAGHGCVSQYSFDVMMPPPPSNPKKVERSGGALDARPVSSHPKPHVLARLVNRRLKAGRLGVVLRHDPTNPRPTVRRINSQASHSAPKGHELPIKVEGLAKHTDGAAVGKCQRTKRDGNVEGVREQVVAAAEGRLEPTSV